MAWLVDDGRVEDADTIYRRFPRLPNFYKPRDAVSGRQTVTNAALQYDQDGMSVYSHATLLEGAVPVEDLYLPEEQGITRVAVSHAGESGLGLVRDVDMDDSNADRGRAHCLVRTLAPPPDKRNWTLARLELRKALEVFDEATGTWESIA